MSDRVDVLLLDVGGVLVLPATAPVAATLAPFGVDVDDDTCERAHYAAVRALDVACADDRWEQGWRSYREAYLRVCGVDEADLDRAVDAVGPLWGGPSDAFWTRVREDSVAALRAIHEQGTRVAIVSNSDGRVETLLRERQVAQVGPGAGVPVEVVIDSHHVGVAKPDPKIFEHALANLSAYAEPSRCLYVGDTVSRDVDGATAAGIPSVLLDPFGGPERCAVPVIASLAEIIDRVRP